MTAKEALQTIRAAGYDLAIAAGGNLRIAPKITDPQRLAWIRTHKAALLDALRAEAPDQPKQSLDDVLEDAAEYYEERAALAEFDGGLSRQEAEAQAARLTAVRYKLRDNEGAGSVISHHHTRDELLEGLRRLYGPRLESLDGETI